MGGKWMMEPPPNSLYKKWNLSTYICWKNNCDCSNCEQSCICDSYVPMVKIPYGLKAMKYAVLKTKENVGLKGIEEYENEYERLRYN